MLRRHVAAAVVAVALLALLGTATPAAAAANGTVTTVDSAAASGSETPVRDASVELITDGDGVVLRPDADQTVRGRTSLPSGAELTVRLRASGESPFLRTRTVTVAEDGTFAATFDFEEVGADAPVEATISVRTPESELEREFEGVIRPASAASQTTTTDTTSVTAPGFGTLAGAVAVAAAVAALARTRRAD